MSRKREVIFFVFVLALILGAYFFAYFTIISPPDKRINAIKPKELTSDELFEMRQKYYEKNAILIEAREKKKDREYVAAYKGIEPYLKMSEYYYTKEYGYISKLSPKQQEKEMKKLVEKKRKETEKYKKYVK